MSIPDRIYNLAKGHLDKMRQRWDEIDAAAQQEIDSVVASSRDTNSLSAWDRAAGKINSANAARELMPAASRIDETPQDADQQLDALEQSVSRRSGIGSAPSAYRQTPGNGERQQQALSGAYKVLGLAPGADWMTIRETYQKLKERAAPERFPDASLEQNMAKDIQRRLDGAFMILTDALSPESARFDRLEL